MKILRETCCIRESDWKRLSYRRARPLAPVPLVARGLHLRARHLRAPLIPYPVRALTYPLDQVEDRVEVLVRRALQKIGRSG